jgi:hypothetical protein
MKSRLKGNVKAVGTFSLFCSKLCLFFSGALSLMSIETSLSKGWLNTDGLLLLSMAAGVAFVSYVFEQIAKEEARSIER